jgi:hypothetical protein
MEASRMRRVTMCFLLMMFLCLAASAQGVLGDVFSGKLVNPQVGAWTWYDISGGVTDKGEPLQLGMMRLAIVGEEKVGGKQGYWLEMQYVPSVGYPSIYLMLLTGPASDPANVHKMFRREGTGKKEEIPVADSNDAIAEGAKPEDKRKLLGEEDVKTPTGDVHSQHYEVAEGGDKLDIWLSESVCPMGIVKMNSGEGGIMLRNHGTGGNDGRSVIDDPAPTSGDGGVKVDVKVEKQKQQTEKPNAKETKKSEKKETKKSGGKSSKGGS